MKKVTSWKELTLREKIGQTVICLSETEKHIEMCGSLEAFLQKYPIGGIFNSGFAKGLLTGENLGFQALLEEYNQYLRVPLIGTADRGAYAASFGLEALPQMAIGATDDIELAYEAGEYQAEDCKQSGVHWLFWPVCDLNISKESPINNIRAVGDDAELTTRIVKAEIMAMKDCGVISSLKHYPGTPYNDAIDPHLAPVDNETPLELWYETYGKMYRELIEAGAPTIMTSHNNLVNYQTEKIDGVYPPATMSYELTTKLLREELGFKGVTVTDALVMGGFNGNKAVENMVNSFLAGNDMLLWPAYEYIDAMEEKILAGEIDERLLDEAVERIWNLKRAYSVIEKDSFVQGDAVECEDMLTEERFPENVMKRSEAESEVAADFFTDRMTHIAEKCLTLVSNEYQVLPVNCETVKRIAIIGVTPDDKQYEQLCGLKPAFEKYGCEVTMRRNLSPEESEEIANAHDLVLYALCRTVHRPIGPLDFWGEEAMSIWASNCTDRKKTVVASFGSPYFYKYYKNSKVTYVNAYSAAPAAIEAFVKAIMGEISFVGTSPVKLL